MESDLRHKLEGWKVEIEGEISKLEAQLRPTLERLNRLREQLSATSVLLSLYSDGGPSNGKDHPAVVGSVRSRPGHRFTPIHEYWVPMLEALGELGGSARSEAVVDKVGEAMKDVLTTDDKERLPNGVEVRWRNRVNWQRLNMVKQGLLRSDSPRGTWEITDKGRLWLQQQKKHAS